MSTGEEHISKQLIKAKAFSSRISKLYELSTLINKHHSISDITDTLSSYLKWIFSFDSLSLFVESQDGTLSINTLSGPPLPENKLPKSISDIPSGTVTKSMGQYKSLLKKGSEPFEEYDNLIMLPLRYTSGDLMGSINFAHSSSPYDEDDIRIAYLLALQVSIAIEKAHNYWELVGLNKALNKEKKNNEELLQNILPESIIEELHQNGRVQPVEHKNVSILFTDFEDFTHVSQQLSSAEIVDWLNRCFSIYDEIMHKYGLEKLKTIGDSYMCACGVPDPVENHAHLLVRAALEIRDVMQEWVDKRKANNELYWRTRIGINSGSLVAGIVGQSKFSYDVWGNTVNVASRVEKNGEPGLVNISEHTYKLIKDDFNCTFQKSVNQGNEQGFRLYTVEAEK